MRWRLSLLVLVGLVGSLLVGAAPAQAAAPANFQGVIDGARFQIDVPQPWNGTVVLWSHGYEAPSTNPRNLPADAPDQVSKAWLLAHGYALAASGYSTQGWAIEQALHDQVALLDHFNTLGFGRPTRTIAWGASLGGIITAGLIQTNPRRFSGAIPLCGVLAGGVGVWNEGLDGQFVFKTLLAPDSALQLANITNPIGNFQVAISILQAANATPQGRARLALVAAVGDLPGWFTPGSPEPARTDFAARAQNQFLWSQNVDFFFTFALRAELEQRAGGNPSWNTGVDYERQLERSINRDEVRALYREAGLSLEKDLETLESAPRIAANPRSVDYLTRFITFNGEIRQPVLTLHTTGDGLVLNQDEQAYASVVRAAGNERLLRQTFVHRAGHCTFTPAEVLAGFKTMVQRLDTGRWEDTTEPAQMNATAASLGVGTSEFFRFQPSVFLRPFDARSEDDD
jgi:pimeloyl-ACP methyl ester carboxylesterase